MTNRLHNLQLQQERLSQALADDPRWSSVLAAAQKRGDGFRLADLRPDDIGDLAQSELFSAYVQVTSAIEEMQASPETVRSDVPAEGALDDTQSFRTRVNIKSSGISSAPPRVADQVDDLTVIRSVDRRLAQALNELGVFSYQVIANWDRYEVRRIRDALGLGKRIWRENWIEQAALLHLHQPRDAATADTTGEAIAGTVAEHSAELQPKQSDASEPMVTAFDADTEASTKTELAAGDELSSVVPELLAAIGLDEPEASLVEQDVATDNRPHTIIKVGRRAQRLPVPAARRFVYLSGVSDEMSEALRSAGVKSLAEIASWTRADVKWFRAILGPDARISRDQWIEQSALLSSGIWTKYALRVVQGETRALVPAPAVDVEVMPSRPEGASTNAAVALPLAEQGDDVDLPDDGKAERAIPAKASDGPAAAGETAKTEFSPVAVRAKLPPTARFDPMRGLTTAIALSKLRRPPPDLNPDRARPQRSVSSETRQQSSEVSSTANIEVPDAEQPAIIESREPVDTTFEPIPSVRLEAPPELSEDRFDDVDAGLLSGADDWDDAEALVVKRKSDGAPIAASPEQHAAAEMSASGSIGVLNCDDDASDEAMREAEYEPENAVDDHGVWGDEAEVVIVAKPRTATGAPAGEARPRPESATERARKRLGLTSHPDPAPERALRVSLDDDHERPIGGYNESVAEATVTIIRAEAREESASSIVPDNVSNDDAKPAQRSAKSKSRAIGSRFLKALTGD